MPFIDHEEFPKEQQCISPAHNPPSHIVLAEGIHTYKCPECGHEQKVVVVRPRC